MRSGLLGGGGSYLSLKGSLTDRQDPVTCAPEPWAQASGTQFLVRPEEGPLTGQAEALSTDASCGHEAGRQGLHRVRGRISLAHILVAQAWFGVSVLWRQHI